MTDFDPDAYLAQKDAPDSEPFDPDAYLTKKPTPKKLSEPSLAMAPVGAAEELAKWTTGAVASIPAGVAYGGAAVGKALGADVNPAEVQRKVQNYLTYQPQSDSAQAAEQNLATTYGPVASAISNAADQAAKKVGEVSPTAETLLREAPSAATAAGGVLGLSPFISPAASLVKGVPDAIASGAEKLVKSNKTIDAQAALDTAAAKQSMGAAASAPRINSLSPALQQAVRTEVQKTGGAISPETLTRHVEADSLPVKIQLTEGQATQDPQLISHEMNNRARTPGMIDRLNQQNQQLVENVRELRDRVGPEVFSTNPVEHGDTLIQSYRDHDAPIKADITAKYKALEDANGGAFPLDTNGFVKSTDAALSKALKSNSVPPDLAATLHEFRNGRPMTFEDFESLRSDAADAARTSTDGRQRAAAGIIRDQLERMPLTPEAEKLKPLADAARAAAKARFDALEADPAYDAAVHGAIPPDRFVHRFVTGPQATRDGVATMRQNLADDPTATQTMGVAALDHLRQSAGIDPMGNGNFTQAGFNKALIALDPKLKSLVDSQTAEHLSTLGNVARYTQVQPRGHFVNNSNTLVGALSSYLARPLEVAGNTVGGGLIPFGTMAKESLAKRAATKAAKKSLEPGAGLGRLKDAGK